MSDDMYERGMEMRRRISGADQVARELEAASEFDRPLYDLITSYCFGALWGRPGLDLKTRAMVTVAIAAATNRQGALRNHVRNAARAGATPEEIREVLLHVAVYCGVPAGGEALRIAQEVLRDEGADI